MMTPSFVHLSALCFLLCGRYKAAGTTIGKYFFDCCGGLKNGYLLRSKHISHPHELIKLNPDQSSLAREMVATSSAFTFVRDPLSRFISALSEIRRRTNCEKGSDNPAFICEVEKTAEASGRPVAEIAIEKLSLIPKKHIDEHLVPQQ